MPGMLDYQRVGDSTPLNSQSSLVEQVVLPTGNRRAGWGTGAVLVLAAVHQLKLCLHRWEVDLEHLKHELTAAGAELSCSQHGCSWCCWL